MITVSTLRTVFDILFVPLKAAWGIRMRQARQLCREMVLGLCIWAIPVTLVLCLLTTQRLTVIAGMLVGTLGAAGILYDMYHQLDIALDLEPKHAQRRTQMAALRRTCVMGVMIALSMVFSQYVHPSGVIFGLFGLKVSALLYPTLHKQLGKRKD